MNFPEDSERFFFCIGPQKTGTTWLYDQLKDHPQVNMPRVKELRYFWEREKLGEGSLMRSLFSKHWHYKEKRQTIVTRVRRHFSDALSGKLVADDLRWDLEWFFKKPNLHWYQSRFPSTGLTGDITPKYSELELHSIKYMRQLYPKAKVVISLRDPIERIWSRSKMNLLKRKGKQDSQEVDDARFLVDFEHSPDQVSNDYVGLVERWKSVFSSDVLVIFYDDIAIRPQWVLTRICEHLGLDDEQFKEAAQRSNKGLQEPVPERFLAPLVRMNQKNLASMRDYFPEEHPTKWYDRYESLMQNHSKG
ncbi:MAG: sulfotransferase [Cyclobacteriaceae bacterium]